MMFRMSILFEVLMEGVMNAELKCYGTTVDWHSNVAHCAQARLLFPLKGLSFGVPYHTFIDYFDM